MVQQVVLYTRVSTTDKSCDRQIAELTAYAKRSRFKVVAVFKETASGTKNDRAERKKVMDLARRRKIDMVLVSELSRWERSTSDLRSTIEELADRQVAIRAHTEMIKLEKIAAPIPWWAEYSRSFPEAEAVTHWTGSWRNVEQTRNTDGQANAITE